MPNPIINIQLLNIYDSLCSLVSFNGISNLVANLTPNPVYTYIKYIWFVIKKFVGNILKWTRAYFFAHSLMVSSIAV